MDTLTLYFSDGEKLSGVVSTKLTCRVNSGVNLDPGCVSPARLECCLAGVALAPGTQLLACLGQTRIGRFWVTESRTEAEGRTAVTAYDSLSRLDRDLTSWLAGLTGWPYALDTFARLVCQACGLTLAGATIPNGQLPVRPFLPKAVTGSQLMAHIAQLAGCFCRADPEGQVCMDWYTEADPLLTPTDGPAYWWQGGLQLLPPITAQVQNGALIFSGAVVSAAEKTCTLQPEEGPPRCYWEAGSRSAACYETAPVEKVQIKAAAKDLGTVYPPDQETGNCFVVEGNPLVTAMEAGELEETARLLYDRLQQTYTPGRLTLPLFSGIWPGQVLQLIAPDGQVHRFPVMALTAEGQKMTLECTGTPTRQDSAAQNYRSYTALAGQILELTADVDGLQIAHRSADGRLGSLEVSLDNVRSRVAAQQQTEEGLQQQISTLKQTGDSLSLQLVTLQQQGAEQVRTRTGYRFDDDGLHISRSGQEMENCIDHTGMQVRRGGTVLLSASSAGVTAVDVTVKNYLVLGDNARLEDYSNGADQHRTACFFTGG